MGKYTRQTISLRDRWKLSQLLEDHIRTFPDREGFCEYVDPRLDDASMARKAAQEIGAPVNTIHVRNMRQAMFGKLRSANTQPAPDQQRLGLAWIENIEKKLAGLDARMASLEKEWYGPPRSVSAIDLVKSSNDSLKF